TNLSMADLNDRNKTFWAKLSRLTRKRMVNEEIRRRAEEDMASEILRGVPLKNRKTLELALADAEPHSLTTWRNFSRKGGKTRKPDSLQRTIQTIFDEDPQISERDLLYRLRQSIGNGVILSVNLKTQKIEFITDARKIKNAPISGLKD